jgi:hypothetical protein
MIFAILGSLCPKIKAKIKKRTGRAKMRLREDPCLITVHPFIYGTGFVLLSPYRKRTSKAKWVP